MKKLTSLAMLLCLILTVPGTALAAKKQVFKIATLAPQGSDWMVRMKAGAKQIAEETEGRVKFKFYAGGIQGNDKKVLRKMRNGQLHGGAFAAGSLNSRAPAVLLYGLPFLFNTQSEVDTVRKEMDKYVIDSLGEAGLVSFGFAGGGFAQIMSNKAVMSVDDLKGLRVWVPEGDIISYRGMEHFGLSPVTLPITDVLTGLQTGLIDVIGSSAIGALVLQWHTKVSHLSSMPVSYLFGTMVIEHKYFKKLKPEDQAIVNRVFRKVYQEIERLGIDDNIKATEALIGSGIKLSEPAPGVLEGLQTQSRALWQKVAKDGVMSLEQLNRMYDILSKYRQANG